jgi:trigger factor
VLEKITESATWDLPEALVTKQTENALRREVLEMQQAGYTTQQILARENELRQQSISSTRQALKEHFVLDRIATKESIEVTPIDIESEINMMAVQRGESARKVRARLQKSGVIENLEAQIRERKSVDLILRSAQFEDVAAPVTTDSDDVQALSLSICGMSSVVVDPNDEDDGKKA